MTRDQKLAVINCVLSHFRVTPASFSRHRTCDIDRREITGRALESYLAIYASLSADEREAAIRRMQ